MPEKKLVKIALDRGSLKNAGRKSEVSSYRKILVGVDKEQALTTLKIKKLYGQYVFATAEALKFLKFVGFEEG